MDEQQVDALVAKARQEMTVPAVMDAAWAVVEFRRSVRGGAFSTAHPDDQAEASDVADQLRAGGWPSY